MRCGDRDGPSRSRVGRDTVVGAGLRSRLGGSNHLDAEYLLPFRGRRKIRGCTVCTIAGVPSGVPSSQVLERQVTLLIPVVWISGHCSFGLLNNLEIHFPVAGPGCYVIRRAWPPSDGEAALSCAAPVPPESNDSKSSGLAAPGLLGPSGRRKGRFSRTVF